MGALTDHVRSSAKSPPLSSHSSSNKGSKSRGRFVSQRLETEERRKYKRSMLTAPDRIPWSQKKKQRLGSPPARSHQSLLLPRFEPATSAANLLSPRRQFSPVTVIRTLESFPIPSPLRRPVQGPQRPQQHSRMFSAPKQLVERVLEAEDLEDESRVWSKLEEQWNPKPRLFEESSNLNDLEDYKWRVSILQRKFDYAQRNDNGGNGVFTRQAGLQITPSSSSTITALDNDGNGVFTRQGGLQITPSSSSTIIALDNGGNGVFTQQGERQIIPSSSSTITALGNGGNEVFTRQEGLQIIPSSSSRITALVDAERGTEATSGYDREAKPDDGNEVKAGSSQPQYKKLFEKAKGKDFHLKRIDLEVQLTTAKLAALQFTGKELFKNKEKEAEVVEQKRQALEEAFAPLNDDDEADVSRALKGRNRKEVLVMHEHSNIEITREILQCLQPGGWLNDEVINLYLELLKEREKREPNKFLKCHFFNTFFYKKLYNPNTNYGYKAVRRWTTQRKIGYSLIDCEKIFVPIHKEIHWCLAIIDMKAKKFQYLDSLKGSDANVLNVLARYITDEAKDKTGQDLDVSSWEIELVEDLPQQENGSDCGMFMIKYADFHSRGLPLSFYQVHMPYFRKRTAKEILRLKAD